MRKYILFFLFIIPCSFSGVSSGEERPADVASLFETCAKLYEEMELDQSMSKEAFWLAYEGYTKLSVQNKSIMTVIDFSLPSSVKRLFILDMVDHKVLLNSYVSHGKNSGGLYATSFSNSRGSHKSSLGFYETESTYIGSNGYSLVLNGLEKGINDQAKSRAIVIHGAKYCTPSVIASSGRLGRSFGCPSVPPEFTKPIINTIKGGTLLYIHARDNSYLTRSNVISTPSDPDTVKWNGLS